MPRTRRSGFADSLSDNESSKLCYDNFPHYEGIKKEVKEQLINVAILKDLGLLLTLVIPSTTNLLLMLYASSEDFLNVDPLYSGAETASETSPSFSSEILSSSGKHDEFASTVTALWNSLNFPELPSPIVDGFPPLPSPPTGLPSPTGAEDVAENKDGGAGETGVPRDKTVAEEAAEEEACSPAFWQAASYADVAAGRSAASLPAEAAATEPDEASPRGLVLADFMAPRYKKKARARKGAARRAGSAAQTPAAAEEQPCEPPAGEAVKPQEASGGDTPAEPEVASASWLPSPPTSPRSADTVFGSANQYEFIRGHWSPWLFVDKVRELEEAGRCFAERLAVGELQPDPAAIFFQLMDQLSERDRDAHWAPFATADGEQPNMCGVMSQTDV